MKIWAAAHFAVPTRNIPVDDRARTLEIGIATTESKTSFFAPIPKGDIARAVCTPLHSGRAMIALQIDITRGDGNLAVTVVQSRIVLPAKARPE